MNIPKPIQEAMKSWCDDYAGHIEYLGEYQGRNAYTYDFENNDLEIGFPVVYLLIRWRKLAVLRVWKYAIHLLKMSMKSVLNNLLSILITPLFSVSPEVFPLLQR